MPGIREGRPLVHIVRDPGSFGRIGQENVPGLDGRRDRIDTADLAAQGRDRNDEHLPLKRLDDGGAVGSLLDEHRARPREEPVNGFDGFDGIREVEALVQAVAQVIVLPLLAPDLDGNKVTVLTALLGTAGMQSCGMI